MDSSELSSALLHEYRQLPSAVVGSVGSLLMQVSFVSSPASLMRMSQNVWSTTPSAAAQMPFRKIAVEPLFALPVTQR